MVSAWVYVAVAAERGLVWVSGGWGEGDGVAEGFELADVVAFLGFWVDVFGVVVGIRGR